MVHPPAHDHDYDPADTPDDAERPLPYQVFGAFHQLVHANRQLMARRIVERGSHPGQTFCLRALAHEDGITQRDLTERLRVARPTVTVMLQKMEKAGLVERRSDELDQRYTRIYLTAEGRALNDAMRAELDRMVADVIAPLPEKDQRELLRLLGLLTHNVRAALESEPAPHRP